VNKQTNSSSWPRYITDDLSRMHRSRRQRQTSFMLS